MKTMRLVAAIAALVVVAACSNPEADWQKAEVENTEAGFQAFLDKYPEGEWAEKAQSQLDSMKDSRDWENAQAADAIEAYNNYLLAHPTGSHMGEARQRISDLETAAAWATAQSTGTREALEDFLLRYADTPQAEQARVEKRFKATIGTLAIQKPAGSDQLWRVKSTGMTEAAARSACQKLKGLGQDCMVVRR